MTNIYDYTVRPCEACGHCPTCGRGPSYIRSPYAPSPWLGIIPPPGFNDWRWTVLDAPPSISVTSLHASVN